MKGGIFFNLSTSSRAAHSLKVNFVLNKLFDKGEGWRVMESDAPRENLLMFTDDLAPELCILDEIKT